MSRYIKEYEYNGSIETLNNFANQFFISNGFVFKEYHGEMVFQKGNGLMVGPKFVKIITDNNTFHIEAWVKFAVLPGVYSGEMDLEGTAGIATKKPLKTIITNFENQILQMGCIPKVVQQPVYQQQPSQPVYQPPVMNNQPVGNTSYANNSYAVNFCSGCGNKLNPNSVFCNSCGRKVK